MKNDSDAEFRKGFISYMRRVADGRTSVEAAHVEGGFRDGYTAGHAHFYGGVSPATARAEALGLVDAYDGFHGQPGFMHPES